MRRTMDAEVRGADERIVAPAAERNKQPILEALREVLAHAAPPAGGLPARVGRGGAPELRVLEVASGTGQHAAHLAAGLPAAWQPTEAPGALPSLAASIRAWAAAAPAGAVADPLPLDAAAPAGAWPVPPSGYDLVFAANVAHISPWAATAGLLAGAARALRAGGALALYGPFSVGGAPTTPGNAAFDAALRAQDAAWGYRGVEDVARAAAAAGFGPVRRVDMPADNFLLVFRLGEGGGAGGGEGAG